MIIRQYKIEDQSEVIQLWEDCSLIAPQNNPILDIQRKLKVNPELFLVGLISGKVISSIMGGYEGHRGWVNYLAVCPSVQRKGYATQLMKEMEVLLTAKGCPKINLQVRETNQSVIDFYASLGYFNDNVVSFGKRLKFDGPSNG